VKTRIYATFDDLEAERQKAGLPAQELIWRKKIERAA